jgi:hypothetical protein
LDVANAKNVELTLTEQLLDRVIFGRLELGHATLAPFNFLLQSWKRAQRQLAALRNNEDEKRLSVLREIKRLCISYAGISITVPDMFP